MKKFITITIVLVLCLSNLGVALADSNVEPVATPVEFEECWAAPTLYDEAPMPVLYNEEPLTPVLISENTPVPVLISTDDMPVLISDNSNFNWYFEEAYSVAQNKPVQKDGAVYLPLREMAETMDFKVAWNGEDSSVDITKGDFTSKMYISNMQYSVNKSLSQFKENPIVIEGKTFLAQVDVEKFLGVFATVQGNNIFLNSENVEVMNGPTQDIADWFHSNKDEVGTHITMIDGVSYVLIVEEEENTGGYTFDFESIEVKGDILQVKYDITPPEEIAIQVLSKPYALLKISSEISDVVVNEYNYTGTIKDLKFDEHGATVYLEGNDPNEMIDDLIVKVHFETEIEDGTFKDFKIGTVLDIQHSISTRSLPAQTNAEKVRVVETPEVYTTYVGEVKEVIENDNGYSIYLTKGDGNYANDLIVKIQKGSYMESEMYELDGKTMTVEYTISTRSLPAQTSPIKILVAR